MPIKKKTTPDKETMSETTALATNTPITPEEVRKFIVGQKLLEKIPTNQIDIAIETARAYNLNPFKREVHFTPFNGELKIIVGYEVYLKRAEATHKLDGWEFTTQGTGQDVKGIITIHRKDWSKPFIHEVYLQEVRQNTPIWTKMPRFMLKKVAVGQGFRLAFPEEMGGLPYTEEELPDMGSSAPHIDHQPAPPAATQPALPAETQPETPEEDEDVYEDVVEAETVTPDEQSEPTCSVCGAPLSPKVADYSLNKLGKYLCFNHQKGGA